MDKLEIRELTVKRLKETLNESECEIKACKDETKKGMTKWVSTAVWLGYFDNDEECLRDCLESFLPEYKGNIYIAEHKLLNSDGTMVVEEDARDIRIKCLNFVK